MLAYVAYLCRVWPRSVRAMCPPSSCHAGSMLRNVTRNPIHAANRTGVRSTSFPGPPLPNAASAAVMRSGSPCPHSCRTARPSGPGAASSGGMTGASYAPYRATRTATARPATGPAIAMSKSISLLTVRPLDRMNAPNVGMPYTGMPGMKNGQDVLTPCHLEAARWPASWTPSMPSSEAVYTAADQSGSPRYRTVLAAAVR